MTKAEMVQKVLQNMEDSHVNFPSGMTIRSLPIYWEKNPAGYVLDEVDESALGTTLESQLACFNKNALTGLLDFPIPSEIPFDKLWQLWGCNGLLTMPAAMIILDGETTLQLRHNLFISYRSCGFVATKDASGKFAVYMPCNSFNSMQESLLYVNLLRNYSLTYIGIYWSYLAQVLAPWKEFPYLLRYNPALLVNFLFTMEKEHPDAYPQLIKGKVPSHALPPFVKHLTVDEDKLMHKVYLVDDKTGKEFAFLELGSNRVSLYLHQVNGDPVYSFDFPEWQCVMEKEIEIDSTSIGVESDLTCSMYNCFMWRRASILLLAMSGVCFNSTQIYTQKSKKLQPISTVRAKGRSVQNMRELEKLINKF